MRQRGDDSIGSQLSSKLAAQRVASHSAVVAIFPEFQIAHLAKVVRGSRNGGAEHIPRSDGREGVWAENRFVSRPLEYGPAKQAASPAGAADVTVRDFWSWR